MTRGSAGIWTRSALLGRGDELAELRTGLDDARDGRGRIFLIAGEAGIGKTRLVEAFIAETQTTEMRSWWGRCWEDRRAPAFWPWVQILGGLVAETPEESLRRWLGPGAEDIAHLVPDLTRRLPGLTPAPPSESPDARLRLFESVLALLRNLASDGGVIVAIDDLHAADEASLQLLQHVAAGVSHSSVVLVGTYRDAEARNSPHLHRTLAAIARHGRRLVLTGLGENDVAALLERQTGELASAALIRSVHHTTDGNPFFVQEAARFLQAGMGGEGVVLPEEVHAMIRRRLDQVSGATRELLTTAAVLGREFTLALLQRTTGSATETLTDVMEAASAFGVVEEVALGRWTFSHALLREALYDDVRPSKRVILHRRAGEALEELQPEDLAALAYHFFEAARGGDGAKAAHYCTLAAQNAMTVLAFEEAVLQFSRALEALTLGPVDERRRCELLMAMGEAKTRAGDFAAAREFFRRALKSARTAGSAELFARAAVGLALHPESRVDHTLRSVLEEARAALPDQEDALLARVLMALAAASYASEARPRLADDALAMARRVGDATTLRLVLWDWLKMTHEPDRLEDRLLAADELLQSAAEAADRERVVMTLHMRADVRFTACDVSGTRADIERALEEAEQLRLPFLIWGSTFPMGTLALLAGQVDEADRFMCAALAAGERSDFADIEGVFHTQLWALRREQGRFDEAAEAASWLVENRRDWIPELRKGMLAVALAEAGRRDEARREVESVLHELLQCPGGGRLVAPALLADTAWLTDEATWASTTYEALSQWPDRHVHMGITNCSLGSSDRYLGQLATLLGRHDQAERHFQAAHRMHERLGSPVWLAHGRVDHARMSLARGDQARARELLALAQQTYRSLGMPVHAERAGALSGTPIAGRAERGNFAIEGEYWAIEYGPDIARLRDSKGLRYLARLLANPGQELHALDLVVGEGGGASRSSARRARSDGLESIGGGDAGAVLDAKAKAAYKKRVMELQEEIEEASAFHDAGRLARAQQEMDFIIAELSAAVGLGGRDRKAASDAEKARQSVTRAIKSAIDRVAEVHTSLGEHLRTTVKTGVYSCYSPDPRAPIEWKVSTH